MPCRPPRAWLLLPLVLLAPAAHAEEDPLAGLSGAAALAIAKDLSTDAMQGRKSGWPAGRRAEDYVAQAMGEMGLDPKDPAGSYLDPFELATTQVKGPVEVALAGTALTYGTDAVDLMYSGGGEAQGDVVFVGYGISAPTKGFDEYAGLDVKGRIVLAMRGAPASRTADFPEERQIGAKSALARERGAKAFLLADGDKPTVVTIQPRWFRADLPAIALSRAAVDRLLAGAKTSLEAEKKRRDAVKEALPPQPTGLSAKVALAIEHRPQATGHNALGAIRGGDPDLRDELIVVGAHMDHLGVDAQGRVYNGADDNASGTAVVLHLARTLTEAGWRPKRTILFVAFGAEEAGLVGSRHLAEGLPFEHGGIACLINLDMVGQGLPEVALVGGERFPEMGARLKGYLPEALAKQVDWKGALEPSGDHWPFAEKGVPSFFLATKGEHANYHAVGDDIEHLKPECLEVAARVLGALLVRLGEEPADLVAPK